VKELEKGTTCVPLIARDPTSWHKPSVVQTPGPKYCRSSWQIYLWRIVVPKKKAKAATEKGQPQRRKLTAEEPLQRMKEFDKRKKAFIAALRKSKGRG